MTTTTCPPTASWSAASYESPPHRRERCGCGRLPLGIMRTALRRTATSRLARPRWPLSRKAGGATYRVDSKTVRLQASDDAESVVLEVSQTDIARSRAYRDDPPFIRSR